MKIFYHEFARMDTNSIRANSCKYVDKQEMATAIEHNFVVYG